MGITAGPCAAARGALATAPFTVETRLYVRHPRDRASSEVRRGGALIDGDLLQLDVLTSADAHLYLAICAQHNKDPGRCGLIFYPSRGSIRTIAHHPVRAPSGSDEIVLDDDPGVEILYVILSRKELRSDAELARAIDETRANRALGSASGSAPAPASESAQGVAPGQPDVAIERGGAAASGRARPATTSDLDAIVVLRCDLDHVRAAAR
jgi:hypothetical protein